MNYLLGAILICEILRMLLVHRRFTKKRHFKDKLQGVERMIYDLEFKKFKTNEIREGVRMEYDNQKSKLHVLEERTKNFTGEEGDKKRLEDQVMLLKRDMERFEAQMKQLDLDVHGSKPTVEYPDGVQGINHQIDSLQELKVMLKDWVKTC